MHFSILPYENTLPLTAQVCRTEKYTVASKSLLGNKIYLLGIKLPKLSLPVKMNIYYSIVTDDGEI